MISAFLLLATVSVSQGTPVDGSMLNQGRLVLRDFNIELPPPPGPQWKWLEMPRHERAPHAYLCVNSNDRQVVAVIVQEDVHALVVSDTFLAHMWKGVTETAKEANLTISGRYDKRVDLPYGPSVLFHYASSSGQHPVRHVFTYVVPTGHLCLIQSSAATDQIPAILNAVAYGAKPLRDLDPEDVFPQVKTASSLWAYLIVGAMTYSFAAAINRDRQRKRNPWSAVLLSIPIVYAGWIALTYRSGIFEDMTPSQAHQAWGFIAGPPILLAVVCLIPWVIRRKKGGQPERLSSTDAA